MPQGDPLLLEVRAWLQKAALDLRAADIEMTAGPALLEDIVFHSQQAAEKAFKAFPVLHARTFRKTHSPEEIGEQCLDVDPSLRSLVDRAVPLTEYAWRFRYPGDPEKPSLQEAEEALALARGIYDAILARVPHEARP
jgi:HEPN domain-containing protein